MTFALYEVALRLAVSKLAKAGAYNITVDYWTSVSGKHLLSITYHWTDENWDIHAQVLDLVPLYNASATGLLTKELINMRTEALFRPRERWGEDL